MGQLAGLSKGRRRAKRQRGMQWSRVRAALAAGDHGQAIVEVKLFGKLIKRHRGQGLLGNTADATRRMAELLQVHPGSLRIKEAGADSTRAGGLMSVRGDFLRELVEKGVLTRVEATSLSSFDLRSPSSLLNLFQLAPVLGVMLDVPRISTTISRLFPAAASAAAESDERARLASEVRQFGAISSHGDKGDSRRFAEAASYRVGDSLVTGANVAHWKLHRAVKDQGRRGTCVAFAVTACAEHHFETFPLSEQFLYHSMKTLPGALCPNEDGSRICEGARALAARGICRNDHWPYDPSPIGGNISHQDRPVRPSPDRNAESDAQVRVHSSSAPYVPTQPPIGVAQQLYDMLVKGPVAISLPVFRFVDGNQKLNNWVWGQAESFGVVLDPPIRPPTSKLVMVQSGGHAVCVVGYQRDPMANGGGVFIIRNSWGTDWGKHLPDRVDGHHAPAPGYGQVSALYIEEYLWEAWKA